MKTIILFSCLISSIYSSSQSLNFYKASNGINYKIGDTVVLGRGSGVNGQFLYVTMGGWGAVLSHNQDDTPDKFNLGRGNAGLKVTIKKIKKNTFHGTVKYIFIVGGGNITNYNLDIESAIETCEIIPCKSSEPIPVKVVENKPDKYDQLKKLKELLDSGAITQDEYDKEKKKILDDK